jgi:8-oxo-dGTP diphosphatase
MSTGRTRLAAYLVALDGGAILLARIASGYPGAGSWTLPGGGVEWGEHPEATLRREVHEETGLTVTEAEFIGIDSRVYPSSGGHAPLHTIRFIYRSAVRGQPHVVETDGSVDAAAWIDLSALDATPQVDLVGIAIGLHAANTI